MDIQKALEILKRGAVDLISEAELEKKLLSGKKLKVKFGADPTSADLHFGHSVVLGKLRAFQDLGHTVALVIGDFTAAIGDPSGRDSTRPMLERDIILKNAKTYTDQAFKVLDPSKTEILFNSSWLDPFITTKDILNALSKITVSQVLEREDFKTRIKAGLPIALLEVMYSLFQGQDSVALTADVELGGTDQIFNLLVGRQLQKNAGQEPQVVMTMPLLVGTDGVKKMSKSYGNYIGISDAPNDMFGKIMSISDETMLQYYTLLTLEDLNAVKAKHPMQAKKDLARILVSRFHSAQSAQASLENFEKVFSKKENPDDMPIFKISEEISVSAVLIANGLSKSKNEARRLIDQGAVKLDGKKIELDTAPAFEKEAVMQIGKRHFIKLIK
ncbi:MAG: tyrosine--tRNA ligase [Elusimicrobiota bacterium]|jgi:tyrosyl-tRNA synthetase|nr:tyrosine--tRNA ligase [Elusimicrobiota bacterium]